MGAREHSDDTISDIWVAPELEGRGAGSALLAEMEVAADNGRALRLYLAKGYDPVWRKVRTDPILQVPLEKIGMQKPLPRRSLGLERFQQKCEAVLRSELRKNKRSERFCDSKKSGNDLGRDTERRQPIAIPTAKPGRPPRISHRTIAEAALEVGFDKLTMVAVAERLGVDHSSL
ncbi:hypothetical protein DES43_1361 [Aquamicrobium defluvii]|uniref:Acetyltransferase (GNAT) family protein n=1 Tax=Aquamicrobium defluvii TaxID=69279 RepID=A0A4R6Y683_9HYPH|nr:hypothetical protein DES43_1361 [Aquamicrobium defluvii]